jgi:uncharacterized protein YigE (DUF2233 family)
MKKSPLLILVLFAFSTWSGCSRQTNSRPPLVSVHEDSKSSAADPRFTTIRVDVRTDRIELFLRDDAGQPFKRFDRLRSWLAGRNQKLIFAMNAGMFERNLSPVGLFVQDGQEVSPLTLSDDTGISVMRDELNELAPADLILSLGLPLEPHNNL